MTLRELIQRSGLEQGTVDEICKKMEEAIEAKNSILRNLKYSLAHATKAYNDAIRVYEAKLVEFGIPAEELGLEPLVTNTSTMPAGLVAAWISLEREFSLGDLIDNSYRIFIYALEAHFIRKNYSLEYVTSL